VLDARREQMPFHVIDPDERHTERPGQGLAVGKPDHQRTGKTGSLRGRNRLHVHRVHTCGTERRMGE
jgi:hypothetical protein